MDEVLYLATQLLGLLGEDSRTGAFRETLDDASSSAGAPPSGASSSHSGALSSIPVSSFATT
jgi:hypothetical protein|tara:strand:+ start:408 stop:593 length:186 start_codon:yes stop_codon:yes gene_type:complete